MATTPEFEAWWATTNLAERRDAWRGWSARDERIKVLEAALELIITTSAARCPFDSGTINCDLLDPCPVCGDIDDFGLPDSDPRKGKPSQCQSRNATDIARTALNQPVPPSTGEQT